MRTRKEKKLDKKHEPYQTKEGYKQVFRPNHPNARPTGYVSEHIYVATNKGEIKLKPGEVVHHKDGNKQNNKRKNLLILSRSSHSKLHARKKAKNRT